MLSYIEIINRAREESGKTPIPLSLINTTNVDAREGRSALQSAIASAFQNLSVPSEDILGSINTTIGTSLLTLPGTADLNVIKSLKRKNIEGNLWLDLALVTKEGAEQLKLQTFAENYPTYYWIDNRQMYILPVPTQAYELQIRYSKIVPLLEYEDLVNVLNVDNELIFALIKYTTGYLKQNSDPTFERYLVEGAALRDAYFSKMDKTLKIHGKADIIKVRTNRADRRF